MDKLAQGMLHLDAGLENGPIFTSISLLAIVVLWECSSLGMPPLTLLLQKDWPSFPHCFHPKKISLKRWSVGPMLLIMQYQVTPICNCSGHLCPFSRAELACCLPQGWHFLGANRASCPLSLPAALGTMGSSELCREGSIPSLLLCCALGLAGAEGPCPLLGRGLWGQSQHPIQSRCRQGCCLLCPVTKLQARGEDCDLIPGCSGPTAQWCRLEKQQPDMVSVEREFFWKVMFSDHWLCQSTQGSPVPLDTQGLPPAAAQHSWGAVVSQCPDSTSWGTWG